MKNIYKKGAIHFFQGYNVSPISPAQQKLISDILYESNSPQAFMIYNKSVTKNIFRQWRTALPYVQPYYAVKANFDKNIIMELSNLGSKFDIASIGEIDLVLQHLKSKVEDSVIYSNPCQDRNHLNYIYQKGVSLTVADSIEQIEKIREVAPNMQVLWRFNVKESHHISNSFSVKFGDDIEFKDDAIFKRLDEIKKRGYNLQGVVFHGGSAFYGCDNFVNITQFGKQAIDIGQSIGHSMNILNLGGGFPFGDISEQNVQQINENTTPYKDQFRTIAQPGRHFSGQPYHICARVIGTKVQNGIIRVTVNQSLYHHFRNVSFRTYAEEKTLDYDKSYSVIQDESGDKTPTPIDADNSINAYINGMTCDGGDVIASNVKVHKNIKEGDWIVVGGMGAYSYCLKSQFNSLQVSNEVIPYELETGRDDTS